MLKIKIIYEKKKEIFLHFVISVVAHTWVYDSGMAETNQFDWRSDMSHIIKQFFRLGFPFFIIGKSAGGV